MHDFDKIKILYPHLQDATIQAQIQSVFNGVNGGADIPFANFGPVIDEIVIQMGGHDPSKYLAEQYAASKTCSENPIGISSKVVTYPKRAVKPVLHCNTGITSFVVTGIPFEVTRCINYNWSTKVRRRNGALWHIAF